MRVGITMGYGVGAHSAFYRAGEEESGREAREQRRSWSNRWRSVELQGTMVSAMKWGRGVDEMPS
jgi:hypothetical protein